MNSTTLTLSSHAREPILRWPIPTAVTIWLAVMWGAGHFLATPPAILLPPAQTIEAQIVELPPDPVPSPPSPKPKPERIVRKRIPVKKPVVKPRPVQRKVATPVKPSPAKMAAPSEIMGARAIYNPLPKIPDDLRDASINTVAVARFHINVDGTATVELIQPTPNPRINQVILATLKTWRFFPALQHGTPVPSLQDIKVAVNVD